MLHDRQQDDATVNPPYQLTRVFTLAPEPKHILTSPFRLLTPSLLDSKTAAALVTPLGDSYSTFRLFPTDDFNASTLCLAIYGGGSTVPTLPHPSFQQDQVNRGGTQPNAQISPQISFPEADLPHPAPNPITTSLSHPLQTPQSDRFITIVTQTRDILLLTSTVTDRQAKEAPENVTRHTLTPNRFYDFTSFLSPILHMDPLMGQQKPNDLLLPNSQAHILPHPHPSPLLLLPTQQATSCFFDKAHPTSEPQASLLDIGPHKNTADSIDTLNSSCALPDDTSNPLFTDYCPHHVRLNYINSPNSSDPVNVELHPSSPKFQNTTSQH